MGTHLYQNLLLFAAIFFTAASAQDGFGNFVRLKLLNYTTWLKANSYDPSRLVVGPSTFKATNIITNMECFISNHGMRGHSNQLDIILTSQDLANGWLLTAFDMVDNVTFYGDYRVNGTILSDRPIATEGRWYISVPFVRTATFRLFFEANANGYLVVTRPTGGYVRLDQVPEQDREIYFQNLLDQAAAIGYEDLIEKAMYLGFHEYMYSIYNTEHPMRQLHTQYWEHVFAETPLADIIGTTQPPSTNRPTTTASPCYSTGDVVGADIFYSHKGMVLNSTVENHIVLEEDGFENIITKTVIFSKERREP